MEEEWRDIEGYEHEYQVSNLGRVRSLDRISKQNHKLKGRFVTPNITKGGYALVRMYGTQGFKIESIHRLVAKAFIPNPDNLPEVNHKDENKQNNCVDNLEWCTRLYNVHYGTGLQRLSDKLKGHEMSDATRLKQSVSMKEHIRKRKEQGTYWF